MKGEYVVWCFQPSCLLMPSLVTQNKLNKYNTNSNHGNLAMLLVHICSFEPKQKQIEQ